MIIALVFFSFFLWNTIISLLQSFVELKLSLFLHCVNAIYDHHPQQLTHCSSSIANLPQQLTHHSSPTATCPKQHPYCKLPTTTPPTSQHFERNSTATLPYIVFAYFIKTTWVWIVYFSAMEEKVRWFGKVLKERKGKISFAYCHIEPTITYI